MARPRPAAADAPIEAAEFARRLGALGPFEANPRLAVALSGGADSMALALLSRDWVRAVGGTLTALIVDHGLRPASADEAVIVSQRAEALGIAARVLTWEGSKPASGIQAAARAARYGLLVEACRDLDILHLLLAHHRDDQAETIELRRSRGSGPAGLAGMPAIREVAGSRLLRPLLGIPRRRLRATAAAAGLAWFDDPANADPRFARAALRRDGFDREQALALGEAAARQRVDGERRTAAFLARHAAISPLGFARLELPPGEAVPEKALASVLMAVSGAREPIRLGSLRRAVSQLQQGKAALTLGGCLMRRTGERLIVSREPAAVRDAGLLAVGEWRLWDKRFHVALDQADEPLMLRALGTDGRAQLAGEGRSAGRRLPTPALITLPSLWKGSRLVWHPLRATAPGVHVTWGYAPAHPLAGGASA